MLVVVQSAHDSTKDLEQFENFTPGSGELLELCLIDGAELLDNVV